MDSIVHAGIFTSQGFFSLIFIAFGLFLIYKTRDVRNPNTRSDKKLYFSGFVSIGVGIIFLIIYFIQLKGVVA